MLKCLSLKKEMSKILVEKAFRSIGKLLIFTLPNETWRFFDERYEWLEVAEAEIYSSVSDFLLYFAGMFYIIYYVGSSIEGLALATGLSVTVGLLMALIVATFKERNTWDYSLKEKPEEMPKFTWGKGLYTGNFTFEVTFHLFIKPIIKLWGKYKNLKREAMIKFSDREEPK